MSNFEYIISSLPYLTMDFKYAGQAGFNSVISDIKRDLDEKDQGLVEFLLKGFSPSSTGTASSGSISGSTSTSATPRSAT